MRASNTTATEVVPRVVHTYWKGRPSAAARRCIARMRELHTEAEGWRVLVHSEPEQRVHGLQRLAVPQTVHVLAADAGHELFAAHLAQPRLELELRIL